MNKEKLPEWLGWTLAIIGFISFIICLIVAYCHNGLNETLAGIMLLSIYLEIIGSEIVIKANGWDDSLPGGDGWYF